MIATVALWITAVGACRVSGLRAALDSLARGVDGRLGIAAMVLETGEAVSVRGHERFPMQSVYKLPIVMAVLSRIDRGQLRAAAQLRSVFPRLRTPDAIQVSAALSAGCSALLTNDRQFPVIPGLRILQLKDYSR